MREPLPPRSGMYSRSQRGGTPAFAALAKQGGLRDTASASWHQVKSSLENEVAQLSRLKGGAIAEPRASLLTELPSSVLLHCLPHHHLP